MAEANSRDARRRRRILEQGSDRLAFITGRMQTLPDSGSSSHSQPSISHHPNTTLPPTTVEDSHSNLQNHEPHHSDYASHRTIQTPPLHKHEDEIEISNVPTEPEHPQVEPQAEEHQPLPQAEEPQPLPQAEEPKPFIVPNDITCAINASKGTRLCCSVVVALLVLASYLGFSLLGTKLVKTVIGFRPLYLVLVTNLTVVVARLVSAKQRGFERPERRRYNASSSSDGDGDKWGAQLARTLELGLLVQNVMDAVFMDCAVYAIVLICGLSLIHT